jgi:hypothetical protein
MVFTEEQFNKVQNFLIDIVVKHNGNLDNEDISFRFGDQYAPNITSLFPVEVRDSTIHGKGVFTTQPVKKGDVLTRYPCEQICYNFDGLFKIIKNEKSTGDFDIKYAQTLRSPCESVIKYIYGNPKNYNNQFCGHLINDSYIDVEKLQTLNDCDLEVFGNLTLDYTLRTLHTSNCAIRYTEYYAYVVALKDIDVNTELLCPYGWAYWCNDLSPLTLKQKFETYLKNLPDRKKQAVCKILQDYFKMSMIDLHKST